MVRIVENTLRDGSYVVDFQFSAGDTAEIAAGLSALGFEYIEVGHGLGLGAWDRKDIGLAKESDRVYIESARKAAPDKKIGVFFIPGIGTEEDIDLAKDAGIDFIRIGSDISRFERTHKYVEHAKKLGLIVGVNLMKSYAVKTYQFTTVAQEIDGWEMADVIYLVDSAGCLLPSEVFEYIDRTKQRVRTPLGFHGHNNLSLGVANTLEAMKGGATYLDTCIRGMGRSAGNAQTEIIIHALQRMGYLNKEINLYDLYDFANASVVPKMPRIQGLSDDEINVGVSKFHTSFMKFANKSVEKYPVDKRRLIKEVSDINCTNPSAELFDMVAKRIRDES